MKVLITIPTWDGWIRYEHMTETIKLLKDERCADFQRIRGRPLEEALNIGADIFLKGDYTHWLNIDADNIPQTNFLECADDDKDVIFFPYPLYQHYRMGDNPCRWGIQCEKPTGKGYQEVEAGASGSMMIAKRVIEAIPQPIFGRTYSEEDGHVTRGVDYKFADTAREAGFEVWTNWDHRSLHYQEVELVSMITAYKTFYGG